MANNFPQNEYVKSQKDYLFLVEIYGLMDLIKAFIAGEFCKIFKKCIIRYGLQHKTDHTKTAMLLGLQPDNEGNAQVYYKVLLKSPDDTYYVALKHDGSQEELSILDVLNVRLFHIQAYDKIAPPTILASLVTLAQENNLQLKDVSVMILTNTEDIFLYLYKWDQESKDGQYGIKELDIKNLF